MNCESPTNLGESCGKCRVCIALRVNAGVKDALDGVKMDLLEMRDRPMSREANLILNEALLVVAKWGAR